VTRRAVTYASYLKVPELLSLQVERSAGADGPEHDELLFIVVHQVYELWFKSLHHELQGVQIALEDGDTDRALHLMNRVLKILKTLVAQRPARIGLRLRVGRLPDARGDARGA
jgi:tryptophan 2,3-dioxygenase